PSFPSPPPAVRICVTPMPPLPALAIPGGPPSRWPSTAAFPSVHTPPAPCTPATSPTDAPPAPPPLQDICSARRSPRRSSRPPAVGLRDYAREAPLLLLVSLGARGVWPRSLPVRSGTRESSPGNRSAPETRSSRPTANGPDPPSGTSALPAHPQTDPAET